MPRFHKDDFSFDPPAHWDDTTVVSFRARSTGHCPTILIARELAAPNDTLRTHADRTLVKIGRQVENFDVLESRETVVGGRSAILLRFSFENDGDDFEQSMVMVDPVPDPDRKVLVLVASAPREKGEEARAALSAVVASLQFGDPRAAVPSTPLVAAEPAPLPMDAPPMVPIPGFPGRR